MIRPWSTRARLLPPVYATMDALVVKKVQHVAAAKRSRQRKSAGQPVRKRRSAAELVALEAKPLEQRTAEEKEAVLL